MESVGSGTSGDACDQHENERLMCSVLNVVIDHSMEDPTPLEPVEFEQQQRNNSNGDKKGGIHIQVPVIRIFGPLLRNPRIGPLQSACLHVHCAFPYLLARPVVAGPDGSLNRETPTSGQVDWDDVQSVEQIAQSIHSTLEASIQSFDMERRQQFQQQQQPESDKTLQTSAEGTSKEPPVIRRVTVVQGRGFYTYCPGPPAPFLRVEYYNPKLRWKVKLVLERGLQVPLSFHPDPEQYDRMNSEQDNSPGIGNDTLKFHCYEAHIPYSMQFFKDWNLAGMSYLHVEKGLIRSLPETCGFVKYRQKPFDKDKDISGVFLASNTPSRLQWSKFHTSDNPTPAFLPPKKCTSADIEIDCTVDALRNVDDVLRTMPSDLEERDKIQWRAVPSLQEIWRQERRRMAKLLKPDDDFLTHPELQPNPDQLPMTLDVKRGAERPGAALAAKGMRSLVKLTHGLEENFQRALKEIVARHHAAIEKVDRQLHHAKTPTLTKPKAIKQMTPDWNDAILALDSLVPEDIDRGEPLLGEAVSALDSLCEYDIAAGSPIPKQAVRNSTPNRGTKIAMDSLDSRHPIQALRAELTPPAPLSYPSSQEIHEESEPLDSHVDPALYSQQIERGDSILDPHSSAGRDIEDYIDPQTLLPYETLDFGEERCRVKFTVDTDTTEMYRICGNLREGCRREGHSITNEDERARPGYYRTITTGRFIDGIIDTSCLEDDVEEEDNTSFERALTILATQMPESRPSHQDSTQPIQNIRSRMLSQNMDTLFAQGDSAQLSGDAESRIREMAVDDSSGSELDESPHQRIDFVMDETQTSQSLLKSKLPQSYPFWVSPVMNPPSRGTHAKASCQLHLVESKTGTARWLRHAAVYSRDQGPAAAIAQVYVHPVKAPPTRRKIHSWLKKRGHGAMESSEKRRKLSSSEKDNVQGEHRGPILEIDSNSRKIVPNAMKYSSQLETHFTLQPQRVEEVQWQMSQPWQLSMSQFSHKDEGDDRKLLPKSGDHTKKGTLGKASLTESSVSSVANASHPVANRPSISQNETQTSENALAGIGAQGGRIHIEGGGTMKAKTRPSQAPHPGGDYNENASGKDEITSTYLQSPISFISIEIHVQCRTGTSRLDSKKIAMAPDSNKDSIFAIVYVFGIDPGGGESLRVLERCCLFVPFEREKSKRHSLAKQLEASIPKASMGIEAPLKVECLESEKRLLLRLSSLVRMKDPDMLLSWDTQGAGLGYIIERGCVISGDSSASARESESTKGKQGIDMISLLGRTPSKVASHDFFVSAPIQKSESTTVDASTEVLNQKQWKGSGLGSDWDERVGAGAAAASIVGRLVFSGWKIVAEEVKHKNYSYLPAVTAAVLNKRIPHHDDLTLTHWYASSTERWRVLHHRLNQATATLLLFDALDIVGRAGEAARLSGVEFSQSFPGIRGSQYKVEGVLLRALQSLRSDERGSRVGKKRTQTPSKELLHDSSIEPSNTSVQTCKSSTQSPWKLRRGLHESASLESRHYFFYSPSLSDANRQEALEVQALTLEPQSAHYKDPVVVCDFTALYPSLMIAYNLCYSTCAGRVEYHSTRGEMQIEGRTCGRLGPFTYPERRTATILKHHMNSLDSESDRNYTDCKKQLKTIDRAYTAPTGTIYVSENVLKGVLPQVLDEILTTRAMLKRAAKEYKKRVKNLSPAILRQLEARQLALKYVANVTYGYTSATFSGRCAMPLLADTIVECGRKTLTKAMNLANQWGREQKWRGAKVIYGDTDSLFVKLPGRSYKEAFDFGEELCKAVTDDNPPPVQLKLEKVYLGSIMQTMKRYCGMKYEFKEQKKPTFEAKGIETIRRDQCALTQKVLKNALITLFRDGIEGVKEYLFRQWSQIEAGQIPVSDFILTGRVRSKYRGGKEGPVQAVLAKRMGEADPGRIIRHKERLPYVIVATPGITFRLKDCVLTPMELLERWDAYTIHSAYYIERHVNAALNRCLGLAPHWVDVNAWYQSCPKPRRRIHFWPVRSRSRAMITTYFGSDVCSLCQRKCQASGRDRVVVCGDCQKDKVRASQLAMTLLNKVETSANRVAKECSRCNGCFEDVDTFAALRCSEEMSGSISTTRNSLAGGPDGDALRIPLANCVCIDCPNTFERHRLREQLIETSATCEVLGLL